MEPYFMFKFFSLSQGKKMDLNFILNQNNPWNLFIITYIYKQRQNNIPNN